MDTNPIRTWRILAASGLLVLAVPAACATAASTAAAPTKAATTRTRPYFRKGPICMCGSGPTEKDIEAAKRRLDQSESFSRTAEPTAHSKKRRKK